MYEFTVDLFEGRCVVVTGAARGIGRATALAFAEHGAAPETTRMDIFPIDNSFWSSSFGGPSFEWMSSY